MKAMGDSLTIAGGLMQAPGILWGNPAQVNQQLQNQRAMNNAGLYAPMAIAGGGGGVVAPIGGNLVTPPSGAGIAPFVPRPGAPPGAPTLGAAPVGPTWGAAPGALGGGAPPPAPVVNRMAMPVMPAARAMAPNPLSAALANRAAPPGVGMPPPGGSMQAMAPSGAVAPIPRLGVPVGYGR